MKFSLSSFLLGFLFALIVNLIFWGEWIDRMRYYK
jgi:hypothetical protein